MYEYRNLSPEEREAVVEERRQHGFSLHAPPHPFREAGWYLITAATFEHKAHIQPESRRTDFEQRLLASFKAIDADIAGWVVKWRQYPISAMGAGWDD